MISYSSWSQSATGYFDKALKKAEIGNTKGAIADYTKAINMNSKFVEAYQNRGVAKVKLNDLKGALADFNKTIDSSVALSSWIILCCSGDKTSLGTLTCFTGIEFISSIFDIKNSLNLD